MANQPSTDPYPKHMREAIKKVEATRTRRMSEEFPVLSADDKASLLKKFHPDHRAA